MVFWSKVSSKADLGGLCEALPIWRTAIWFGPSGKRQSLLIHYQAKRSKAKRHPSILLIITTGLTKASETLLKRLKVRITEEIKTFLRSLKSLATSKLKLIKLLTQRK
jgi:hypothetical protein